MATVLHVQATMTPERSYSLKTAQAFLESYVDSHPGDAVRTLDLAADTIPEFDAIAAAGKYRILRGKSHTSDEARAWEAVVACISDLQAADKLVISSPMWNFSIPYRLKQYIDVVIQPGHTFAYSPEDGYVGLLTGRPAMLILARGGEYARGGEAAGLDFQRPYLESVLRFIGFTDIETIVVEPTLLQGREVAAERLAAAIAIAREKAKSF